MKDSHKNYSDLANVHSPGLEGYYVVGEFGTVVVAEQSFSAYLGLLLTTAKGGGGSEVTLEIHWRHILVSHAGVTASGTSLVGTILLRINVGIRRLHIRWLCVLTVLI